MGSLPSSSQFNLSEFLHNTQTNVFASGKQNINDPQPIAGGSEIDNDQSPNGQHHPLVIRNASCSSQSNGGNDILFLEEIIDISASQHQQQQSSLDATVLFQSPVHHVQPSYLSVLTLQNEQEETNSETGVVTSTPVDSQQPLLRLNTGDVPQIEVENHVVEHVPPHDITPPESENNIQLSPTLNTNVQEERSGDLSNDHDSDLSPVYHDQSSISPEINLHTREETNSEMVIPISSPINSGHPLQQVMDIAPEQMEVDSSSATPPSPCHSKPGEQSILHKNNEASSSSEEKQQKQSEDTRSNQNQEENKILNGETIDKAPELMEVDNNNTEQNSSSVTTLLQSHQIKQSSSSSSSKQQQQSENVHSEQVQHKKSTNDDDDEIWPDNTLFETMSLPSCSPPRNNYTDVQKEQSLRPLKSKDVNKMDVRYFIVKKVPPRNSLPHGVRPRLQPQRLQSIFSTPQKFQQENVYKKPNQEQNLLNSDERWPDETLFETMTLPSCSPIMSNPTTIAGPSSSSSTNNPLIKENQNWSKAPCTNTTTQKRKNNGFEESQRKMQKCASSTMSFTGSRM